MRLHCGCLRFSLTADGTASGLCAGSGAGGGVSGPLDPVVIFARVNNSVRGRFRRRDDGVIPRAGEVLHRVGSLFWDSGRLGRYTVFNGLGIQHRIVLSLKCNGVSVGGMLCVQGDAVFGGGIGGARVADFVRQFRVAVPAVKGAAFFGGCRQGHAAHGLPFRKEIGSAVVDGGQVADFFLISINAVAAGGNRPAVKACGRRGGGVTAAALVVKVDGIFFLESVGRQVLGRIIGEILIRHLVGGGAVAVEMYLVGVGRPLGEIRGVGCGRHGHAAALLSFCAIRIGEPAAELIAVPGGARQRDGGQRPVGEQREGPGSASQIENALAVIVGLCTGSGCGPAVKGCRCSSAAGDGCIVCIAILIIVGNGVSAGKAIARQVFGRVKGVGGGTGGTARGAVPVVGDGIGDGRPLGVQRLICGGSIGCAASADGGGAGRFSVPAAKGVTRTGGGGQRDGGQRPVGVQRHCRVVGCRKVRHTLIVVIFLCAGCGGGPAVERRRGGVRGICTAGVIVVIRYGIYTAEAVGSQVLRHVVGMRGGRGGTAGSTVAVVGDGIGVGRPLGGIGSAALPGGGVCRP